MNASSSPSFTARFGALALALLSGALFGPATSLALGRPRGALALFALPLGLVLGLVAWGALAFVVRAAQMLRQRSLNPASPPGPPPGAWTLLFASPLAALAVSLFERVFDRPATSALALDLGLGLAHGALCYALARRRYLDPGSLGEGAP